MIHLFLLIGFTGLSFPFQFNSSSLTVCSHGRITFGDVKVESLSLRKFIQQSFGDATCHMFQQIRCDAHFFTDELA